MAHRHAISAIGHGVGHIDDIDDSSAFHRAAALIVGLLRRNGFVLVESKGVMIGEVGACDGSGLGVDLGVQALELARFATGLRINYSVLQKKVLYRWNMTRACTWCRSCSVSVKCVYSYYSNPRAVVAREGGARSCGRRCCAWTSASATLP